MGVILQCRCGNYLQIASERGETAGRCARCGQVVSMPQMVAMPAPPLGYAGPAGTIAVPTVVSEKFRAPGKPPCFLTIRADAVDLKATFDCSPVLIAFVEGFAKKLKKQFEVKLTATPQAAGPGVVVNVVKVDEGSRAMRYWLLFAGHTIFEIEGEVISSAGQRVPFRHKNRGVVGLFGGDSLEMLKMGARTLGKKVGKELLKVG